MQATTVDPQANPQKRPRKWLPVLAAGIVLALVGVFRLTNADPSTPLEVAERYLSARDAYDVEAARALIAADAQLSDMPVIGVDEFEAGFEMLSIYEMSYDPFECTQGEGAGANRVRCSYKLYSALNDPVGYPPVTGNMSFEIVDGKILQLNNQFPFGLYSPNVFRPFVDWVIAEHGEQAIDRLYRILPSGTATPRLDPESLDYTRTVLAEYKQAANAP